MRLLQSFRYYRASQLKAKLFANLRKWKYKNYPYLLDKYSGQLEEVNILLRNIKANERSFDKQKILASDIGNNRFTFLNDTQDFGESIDWNMKEKSKLWMYNLHYFEYVRSLGLLYAAYQEEEIYNRFKGVVTDWIDNNPIPSTIGWDAYPLSLRVVNWLYGRNIFADPLSNDKKFHDKFNSSIIQQSLFLEDNLEYASLGNHLIENAKTLILCGLSFKGAEAERWLQGGNEIFWNCMKEQINDDGGHFERSPMYHSIVLAGCLELLNALDNANSTYPDWFKPLILTMAEYLNTILHPDGEIPLFQDSAFGIAYRAADLLNIARELVDYSPLEIDPNETGELFWLLCGDTRIQESEERNANGKNIIDFRESGYLILNSNSSTDRMIIDKGEIAPDHIPAHCHSSIFSYELSIGGKRVIVDSGVELYNAGERRDYYRGTSSHNTLTIDGNNQSDVWSRFRAGSRARITNSKILEQEDYTAFMGSHNGYKHQKGYGEHWRSITALKGRAWLVVDNIEGRGRHNLESFIHLHPSVELNQDDESPEYIRLTIGEINYTIFVLEDWKVKIVKGKSNPLQGWYAEEFGNRVENNTIILSKNGELPESGGYFIYPTEWGKPSINWEFTPDKFNFSVDLGND